MLRHLAPSQNEEHNVLTLARPDETSIPAHAQKLTVREIVFPKARDFR